MPPKNTADITTSTNKTIITRFAPSPTGMLHLGSARTALFNWLFARHHGGTFLLRIEDTDRARSTDAAVKAIFDAMTWLGLDADAPPVFQNAQAARHQAVAQQLLDAGHAYKCFSTPAELDDMRQRARDAGKPPRYDGTWRERGPEDAPKDIPYVIRFKAPATGQTTIHDLVQGTVTLENDQLDDLILLRADGSPTYMLSVVVDDHDMAVTHVIRGDDHFTNTFRQAQIYKALDWDLPTFGHIPLIHGPDGAKLSKRHGALGVAAYEEMGFLPAAMNNYLLRLGWSHGDAEILSAAEAISLFDEKGLGKSPARFDMEKLLHLNGHYIRASDNASLVAQVIPHLKAHGITTLSPAMIDCLTRGMEGLKSRAKTLCTLSDNALVYLKQPHELLEEAAAALLTPENLAHISDLCTHFAALLTWTEAGLEQAARDYATAHDIKLGKLAQPLRAKLTGRLVSPSVFDMMAVLGKTETLSRLSATR